MVNPEGQAATLGRTAVVLVPVDHLAVATSLFCLVVQPPIVGPFKQMVVLRQQGQQKVVTQAAVPVVLAVRVVSQDLHI
jgi:hypothetical protein